MHAVHNPSLLQSLVTLFHMGTLMQLTPSAFSVGRGDAAHSSVCARQTNLSDT